MDLPTLTEHDHAVVDHILQSTRSSDDNMYPITEGEPLFFDRPSTNDRNNSITERSGKLLTLALDLLSQLSGRRKDKGIRSKMLIVLIKWW
jgi:hypothetical protein